MRLVAARIGPNERLGHWQELQKWAYNPKFLWIFGIVEGAVERLEMTDDFDPKEFSDNTGSSDGLPSVELEFATLRRFREEMAPYLNYDGFFARSDRPLPRGTSVEFKFAMPEDFVLAEV